MSQQPDDPVYALLRMHPDQRVDEMLAHLGKFLDGVPVELKPEAVRFPTGEVDFVIRMSGERWLVAALIEAWGLDLEPIAAPTTVEMEEA